MPYKITNTVLRHTHTHIPFFFSATPLSPTQAINHSPWNNITLADFVMPWFLFMVGTSAAFSLRKFQADRQARVAGSKYVAVRALKLYLLGVLLQGGGWFGSYSYGFNLSTIRWCGILNRIGFAYLVVGLMEIWFPVNGGEANDQRARCCRQKHHGCYFFRVHAWKWIFASFFIVLHVVVSFGMYVPSWESEWGFNTTLGDSVKLTTPFTIQCNLRGWETMKNPACSATGYFDRALFGQDHLGVWMSQRLPECSSCPPGEPDGFYRPTCHKITPGPNSTAPDNRWCFAHIYDPEGALATVPTVMSAYLGTHFGRVVKSLGAYETPRRVLLHWGVASAVLIGAGLAVHAALWEMNKQLWTTSYVFFMAGTCGGALTIVYALVDAPARRDAIARNRALAANGPGGGKLMPGGPPASSPSGKTWWWFAACVFYPLQTFGMNSILAFFWHGTAESLLDVLYVNPPVAGQPNDDVPRDRSYLFGEKHGWFNEEVLGGLSHQRNQLVYVMLKISCFMVVLWYCARVGYFWKV